MIWINHLLSIPFPSKSFVFSRNIYSHRSETNTANIEWHTKRKLSKRSTIKDVHFVCCREMARILTRSMYNDHYHKVMPIVSQTCY